MVRTNKKNGFTLVELIIVIAILAVLAAVLIPTFSNMIEDANNAVDLNNAKAFANAITYYCARYPDKMQDLIDACATPGSVHNVQISVGRDNSAMNTILAEALEEAGYIESAGPSSKRYTEIKCKSRSEWDGYYVVVRATPDGLTIAYSGHKVGGGGVHTTHSWGYYYPVSMDPTKFSSMMG